MHAVSIRSVTAHLVRKSKATMITGRQLYTCIGLSCYYLYMFPFGSATIHAAQLTLFIVSNRSANKVELKIKEIKINS